MKSPIKALAKSSSIPPCLITAPPRSIQGAWGPRIYRLSRALLAEYQIQGRSIVVSGRELLSRAGQGSGVWVVGARPGDRHGFAGRGGISAFRRVLGREAGR